MPTVSPLAFGPITSTDQLIVELITPPDTPAPPMAKSRKTRSVVLAKKPPPAGPEAGMPKKMLCGVSESTPRLATVTPKVAARIVALAPKRSASMPPIHAPAAPKTSRMRPKMPSSAIDQWKMPAA